MFETAHNAKDPEEKRYEELYQRVIKESDTISMEVFTPDYIKKQAPRDLLTPDTLWNPVKDLQGFSFGVDRGVAHISNVAESKYEGTVSVGDLDFFRDFVLEMEFTLVKGHADVYLRLGKRADSRVYSFRLDTEGRDAIVAGQQYRAEVTFIGSTVTVNVKAEGVSPRSDEVFWGKSRKGAIGFVLPPGSELTVSQLRIRVLR